MIDRKKAIAAVGEQGVELYEKILGDIQKFETVGSSGRIGGKLFITCKIRGKRSVYIEIYKDKVDVQLGEKPNRNMTYEDCIVELERFLGE